MSDIMPLQPEQTVARGRFVLAKRLGRGGMGVVWLARDQRLQEEVALKFLPAEISADTVALDDLRRETARSHKLSHPNIVRIHDLHEEPGGLAFIVMEYIDGPTLAALRIRQPARVLAWDYMRPVLQHLCVALDYAHSEKVIHRDLKPSNMMVDGRGRLKLADFGIAAAASDSMSRISARHSTSGTLPYMSPQQLTGKRPQVTDDIYALGATLYELLTSKPPFHSGDITHQVLHVAPEPMDERLAALGIENPVPPDVSAMVMACLAKEPAQRPQSAQAVAAWIGRETPPQPIVPEIVVPDTVETVFSEPEPEPIEPAPEQPASQPIAQADSPGKTVIALGIFTALILVAVALRYSATHRAHPATPASSAAPSTSEVVAPGNPAGDISRQTVVTPAASGENLPRAGLPWTNSLGEVFVHVPGVAPLFGIWDVRVVDFEAFAADSHRYWSKPEFPQGPDHPATKVSWDDARAFCAWLTDKERALGSLGDQQRYRLPTDAEWSLAVGLGAEQGATPEEKDGKIPGVYPWGTLWPPPPGSGNYADETARSHFSRPDILVGWIAGYTDGYVETSPVGAFNANRYGLYDMGGNVWQWCEDWYGAAQVTRVLRGGSWHLGTQRGLLSSFRYAAAPELRLSYAGFRCVLEPGQ